MSQRGKWLSSFYVSVALLALVACWRQNILFMQDAGVDLATGFVAFWPALLVNHATTSITVDIFLLCVAAMTWMVLEARRLGIRYVWAYVLLSFPIAISVTFPLFLVARERAMANQPTPAAPAAPASTADRIGLAVIALMGAGLAFWTFTQ